MYYFLLPCRYPYERAHGLFHSTVQQAHVHVNLAQTLRIKCPHTAVYETKPGLNVILATTAHGEAKLCISSFVDETP